ncbi:unknown [Clostridium sp. CAG:306]|jgi:hypothetical protein|nr:unknown [Clostridium sp. CAG:306]
MSKEKSNELKIVVESNFTLFDLRIRASQIKNGYLLRNSLSTLADFVESSKLQFKSV